MPVSIKVSFFPLSTKRHLEDISIKLSLSEGLVRSHKDLGTTPNMAPPSSLKFPASIENKFIFSF